MNILAIDVGGTHVKVLASGRRKPLEIPSGPKMTAKEMVRQVRQGTTGWRYSFVSIGYPGPVLHGTPVHGTTACIQGLRAPIPLSLWVGANLRIPARAMNLKAAVTRTTGAKIP